MRANDETPEEPLAPFTERYAEQIKAGEQQRKDRLAHMADIQAQHEKARERHNLAKAIQSQVWVPTTPTYADYATASPDDPDEGEEPW